MGIKSYTESPLLRFPIQEGNSRVLVLWNISRERPEMHAQAGVSSWALGIGAVDGEPERPSEGLEPQMPRSEASSLNSFGDSKKKKNDCRVK